MLISEMVMNCDKFFQSFPYPLGLLPYEWCQGSPWDLPGEHFGGSTETKIALLLPLSATQKNP